jgi:hypothetical protein
VAPGRAALLFGAVRTASKAAASGWRGWRGEENRGLSRGSAGVRWPVSLQAAAGLESRGGVWGGGELGRGESI